MYPCVFLLCLHELICWVSFCFIDHKFLRVCLLKVYLKCIPPSAIQSSGAFEPVYWFGWTCFSMMLSKNHMHTIHTLSIICSTLSLNPCCQRSLGFLLYVWYKFFRIGDCSKIQGKTGKKSISIYEGNPHYYKSTEKESRFGYLTAKSSSLYVCFSLPRFWFIKLLILAAMCSGAFFIPDQNTFIHGTNL